MVFGVFGDSGVFRFLAIGFRVLESRPNKASQGLIRACIGCIGFRLKLGAFVQLVPVLLEFFRLGSARVGTCQSSYCKWPLLEGLCLQLLPSNGVIWVGVPGCG